MSTPSLAAGRAQMPEGTHQILDQRTLEASYRTLTTLIKPGMTVLDVGCGSGAITRDIAALAGETGKVTGMDPSEHLIAQAREKYQEIPSLEFVVADVYTYSPTGSFDVVASARTLQWLAQPQEALLRMAGFLKAGGILSVLDYNHEKLSWQPIPPPSMLSFYHAFLQWRADAGMQNDIADRLAEYFQKAGLQEITISHQSESVGRADAGYASKMGIWAKVAETRGQQMVADGYVTEAQRLAAMRDYTAWLETEGDRMEMYLLAVEGRK